MTLDELREIGKKATEGKKMTFVGKDGEAALFKFMDTAESHWFALLDVAEAVDSLRTIQTLQYVTGRTDEEISDYVKKVDAALRRLEEVK